jgi:hypothetical protein
MRNTAGEGNDIKDEFASMKSGVASRQWFTPSILTTWEAEIRRTEV